MMGSISPFGRVWRGALVAKRTPVGDQRGQILIVTVLSMTVLLGFAALSIDASFMYDRRNQLYAAADAAAKSVAAELHRLQQRADRTGRSEVRGTAGERAWPGSRRVRHYGDRCCGDLYQPLGWACHRTVRWSGRLRGSHRLRGDADVFWLRARLRERHAWSTSGRWCQSESKLCSGAGISTQRVDDRCWRIIDPARLFDRRWRRP